MHDTTGCSDCAFTRRTFLGRGITFASLAATAPWFIERAAAGMALPAGALVSSQAGVPEDRVLVVVQLGGGNDGLNTVIPYGSADYYRARPGLGIAEPGRSGAAANQMVLPVNDRVGIGLHPAMAPFKELMDEGVAAIVQGVGYPNPNRSHFTSMDIWHTADASGSGTGWIGRYYDHACQGDPNSEALIAIGNTAPLAMHGEKQPPISFTSANLFKWAGGDLSSRLNAPYREITRDLPAHAAEDSQMGFLMRTALDAQLSSERITRAAGRAPLVPYPGGPLSDQLRLVGAMIRDGLRTRVYYVSLGGFDTHANQGGAHAGLLAQTASALRAFHADLKAQGNSGRVMTMVFSEFGRRVAQNGSGGTDHGTAAPMFLIGDQVRPGLLGEHPSLTRLDDGDLIHTVDFRCVYAGILKEWMGADPAPIVGAGFAPARVVRA